MKCRLAFLTYPLFIFFITGSACSLTSNLAPHFGQGQTAVPTRPRRYVILPPAPVTATVLAEAGPVMLPDLAQDPSTSPVGPGPAAAEAVVSPADPSGLAPSETLPPVTPVSPAPLLPSIRPSRETATPTPDNFARLFEQLLTMFNEPTPTPTDPLRLAILPTIPPTPTDTATPTATGTPLPTDTPTATPVPLPTDTSTPIPTNTSPPPPAIAPVQAPPLAVESVNTSPIATPVPESGFDFLLAEFYNSPTTNSFLVIYVAIVDAKEIPIGDLKIVGTRLDHNLTYESPLSTWHYEGYNAPGEVIKSGNVKFEPPGGIETTHWILHLEDAHGIRMSEDIPFDTDQNSKQWYFIKLKRKF